jgi:hypothetical protein
MQGSKINTSHNHLLERTTNVLLTDGGIYVAIEVKFRFGRNKKLLSFFNRGQNHTCMIRGVFSLEGIKSSSVFPPGGKIIPV